MSARTLKLQVQAISLVIISGIVVSLAGAAYFWGKPMLEKRNVMTDVATAETFIIQLDRFIADVARSGGEKSLGIPNLPGASISVNTTENSVTYSFVTIQSFLAIGDRSAPIPIETQSLEPVGSYGESPRIITLVSEPAGNDYLMKVKIVYRELESYDAAYMIELGTTGTGGRNKVVVSYRGKRTVAGGATNDDTKDLVLTEIDVRSS